LGTLGGVLLDGAASAVSPCAGSLAAPNALTTTSTDGTKVYGSACSDRIVVTSPKVREVLGGEGDDTIFANPNVERVDGGEGDDTIYGELPATETGSTASASRLRKSFGRVAGGGAVATASIEKKECKANEYCFGGIGSQELIGSSGNDKIFGQRGNDILKGNEGNDELFGGVGDESLISGGAGNDLLSGGLGTDTLNGNEGSDLVRGDGTIDTIEDTGASGTDTLSFATGVTPGFSGAVGVAGFPGEGGSEERGVYVRLDGVAACSNETGSYQACNNGARYGGGNDEISVSGFENVIGSPFADEIVGSSGANRLDGGGGADVIYGGEGNDELYGGADGDYLVGEVGEDTAFGGGGSNNCVVEKANECSGTAESVTQRDHSKISVGFMVASPPETLGWIGLYLTGSTGADHVKAKYETGAIIFTTEGESAQFDTSSGAKTPGCFTYEATKVECGVSKSLDSITLAGMAGDDTLTTEGFSVTTTPVLLGGEGNDTLTAQNGTEDVLVDGNGSGNDSLSAGSYDDALLNNEGADKLEGGLGNDLLISVTTCDGDTLQGATSTEGDGAAQNSASWAQLPAASGGVVADLASQTAGNTGGPACSAGTVSALRNIDDIEASNQDDKIYGDGNPNNLLGRPGKDEIFGRAGADNIEAKDGIAEVGGGGEGSDTCTLDSNDSFNSCNP